MPSFDIVSEIDMQEVDNAVNQAKKEIGSRYDLRGSKADVVWDKEQIQLIADDEKKVEAVKDILQSKMHRRGIDIQALKFEKPELAGNQVFKQKALLKQGIDKEISKKIMKVIKDSKMKVQAQIEGEKIRVTSKSIDELRLCISKCKSENFGVPLQFTNMR